MKKITINFFVLMFLTGTSLSFAQTLNQSANWPNAGWTLSGTYTPAGLTGDPAVDATFGFDDDAAGNPSVDNPIATSPVIDLTAASTAGETWISISGEVVYRALNGDILVLEVYDADAVTWSPLETFIGNSTNLDYQTCASTVAYTTPVINISAYTATQLSGFQYRFSYDDLGGWQYGYCLSSPTITSETPPSCPVPMGLASSAIGLDTASFSWTTGGTETAWEYVNLLASDPAPTAGTATGTMTYMATGLTASTDYVFYVRSDCGGSFSDFTSIAYSTSSFGEVCETAIDASALPYSTTDDTVNYGDDYAGVPGTTCGATSNYLNGDDVVYSYTATADTQISIDLTPTATYSGIFVYADCADIGTACLAGVGNSGTDIREIDLDVITGETYYIVISTWATPQSTAYTLDIYENSCAAATVTYDIVNDCDVSGGFLVDVEITDMGSATDILVSNDQDATTFTVTSAMTVQFGPYTNGTDVIFILDDQGDDDTCTVISSAQTQAACPPANDECSAAIELTVNEDYNCGSVTSGTVLGATDSGVDTCGGTEDDDVWYSFVATSTDHRVSLINIAGNTTDMYHAVYDATVGCGALIEALICNDGNTSDLSDLVIGNAYFVQVYTWTSTADRDSTFDICIGTQPATTADFCNLQWPPDGVITQGDSFDTYAQVYEAGLTDGEGQAAGIEAWIGYNTTDATTTTDFETGWTWVVATYNTDNGNNDEYTAEIGSGLDPNTYYYVSRFSIDAGPYTYGGINPGGSDGNFWDGTSYVSGELIVSPPPVPDNDDIANATAITLGEMICDGNTNNGTNLGASDSGEGAGTCYVGGAGSDVWYTFTLAADDVVTVSTDYTGGTLVDTQIAIFSGTTGALTQEACDQDGGVTILSNGSAWNSLISDQALTAGTYYVQVSGYNGNVGTFCLSVDAQSLGIDDVQNEAAFTYYPNPVKNTLTLNAQNTIEQVAIYNMLGQEVLRVIPNTVDSDIDMSSLQTGTYFVKVTIANVTETIRVIKQ